MADFGIPKGKDYTFTVKVMEKDSTIAQDLTNMEGSGVFKVFKIADQATIITANMTVPDDIILIPAEAEVPQVSIVTVAVVEDEVDYSVTVDLVTYMYTSQIGDTNLLIVDGLEAALVNAPVTLVDNADGTLTLTAKDVTFNLLVSSNMYYTTTTAGKDAVAEVTSNYAVNGILMCTLPAADGGSGGTDDLVLSRSTAVDDYYNKIGYQASIDVAFTVASDILPVFVVVPNVVVTPTGV